MRLDVTGDPVVHSRTWTRKLIRRTAVAANQVALIVAEVQPSGRLGAQLAVRRHRSGEVRVVARRYSVGSDPPPFTRRRSAAIGSSARFRYPGGGAITASRWRLRGARATRTADLSCLVDGPVEPGGEGVDGHDLGQEGLLFRGELGE